MLKRDAARSFFDVGLTISAFTIAAGIEVKLGFLGRAFVNATNMQVLEVE